MTGSFVSFYSGFVFAEHFAKREKEVLNGNITPDALIDYYDNWADNGYDEVFNILLRTLEACHHKKSQRKFWLIFEMTILSVSF